MSEKTAKISLNAKDLSMDEIKSVKNESLRSFLMKLRDEIGEDQLAAADGHIEGTFSLSLLPKSGKFT